MPRGTDAKLVDIAQAADCSPATVSRVMNNNPSVGADVRRRVLQAAAELRYTPLVVSRSKQTSLAGAVIPTIGHAIYATMIDGLQARLAEKNTGLIISTSMYDIDLELEQTKLLLERGASSIVLVGAEHRPQTIELLEARQIPYVFTYTSQQMLNGVAVGFDNYKAGRLGARFLFDLGHRNLAMISGVTQDNDRALGRANGFREELLQCGIRSSDIPIEAAPYNLQAGYSAMKMLMEVPSPPTAVFCGSDILAAGALKYCANSRIAVPGAVSLLGFDNLEITQITTPELSTLEVPAREMGRIAGDYIVASAAQRRHFPHQELAVSVVVRGTTAPLRRT